jgi:uncharacterized protein
MRLTLIVQAEQFAVCRLSADAAMPMWIGVGFSSVTRTEDELSIVCVDDERIPADVRCERGWRLLRVAGTQAFTLTGVLSSVLEPLANDRISIFAISTFDTDYVMVKEADLSRAIQSLKRAGHEVRGESRSVRRP